MEYQLQPRAIKRILGEELDFRRNAFYHAYPNFIMSDTMKEMVESSYRKQKELLKECETYEELESFIEFAGYRMSLEDWVSSL